MAIIADVLAKIILGNGFLEIAHDRRCIRNRLARRPWLKAKAERVHIGIGPDAGVAEQIPCAAEIFPTFHDGKCLAGTELFEVYSRPKPRNPCANDQRIDMFNCHGHLSYLLSGRFWQDFKRFQEAT